MRSAAPFSNIFHRCSAQLPKLTLILRETYTGGEIHLLFSNFSGELSIYVIPKKNFNAPLDSA